MRTKRGEDDRLRRTVDASNGRLLEALGRIEILEGELSRARAAIELRDRRCSALAKLVLEEYGTSHNRDLYSIADAYGAGAWFGPPMTSEEVASLRGYDPFDKKRTYEDED